MVWERTRHLLRLRSALREYFPAALQAFDDLDAPEAIELLAAAPDPDRAARLSKAKITAALKRANRRGVQDKAAQIQSILRASALHQPAPVQGAFAVIATSEIRIIAILNLEIERLSEVVAKHFGRHPDAEIYASPASASSSAPGSSASSAMTHTASPTPKPARTTPAPHR
jgi:hypothetical protein